MVGNRGMPHTELHRSVRGSRGVQVINLLLASVCNNFSLRNERGIRDTFGPL